MAKQGTFRKVEFEMISLGMGQYSIEATYKGKKIKAHSTNSVAYDYLDDEFNKEAYQDARRACYYAIVCKYEELY